MSPYFLEVESMYSGFHISPECIEPRFWCIPRAFEVLNFDKRAAPPTDTTPDPNDFLSVTPQQEVCAQGPSQSMGTSIRHFERAI